MKHKPTPIPTTNDDDDNNNKKKNNNPSSSNAKPIKLPLKSGDMILMRGPTQSNWLHSIPKRSDGGQGRINITFRKALVKAGTENYYRYNVGNGPPWRWDDQRAVMRVCGSVGRKVSSEEEIAAAAAVASVQEGDGE